MTEINEYVEAEFENVQQLKGYLAFRHFFSHAYSFDLEKERIIPLVERISEVLSNFRNDIEKSLS